MRGAARGREFAIRLATGAAGSRLLRQLLTETLVIFVLGAGAGLLVAHAAIQALVGVLRDRHGIPIVLDVRYDWRLAAFAAAVALVAGLLTGLWPAVRALRTEPQPAMKEADGRLAGTRPHRHVPRACSSPGRWRLSLVLLVGAVLFVKTMVNLRAVDLGFTGPAC